MESYLIPVKILTSHEQFTDNQPLNYITPSVFSFFNAPITNTKPWGTVSLSDVHSKITGTEYKHVTEQLRTAGTLDQQKAIKAGSLPSVTFSAIISGSRSTKNATTHSSYLCIDVDHLESVTEVKRCILSDDILYPELVFVSPRGNGLKVIYSIPQLSADPKLHKEYYQAVRSHFETKYHVVSDSAPGNIASTCFLCHDPEAYFRSPDSSSTDWNKFLKSSTGKGQKEKKPVTSREYSEDGVYTSTLTKAANKFLPADCHYNDVASFIGKCIAKRVPEADTTNFLKHNEELYQTSETLYGKLDVVEKLVTDLYLKYYDGMKDQGYIILSPKDFAYGIYKWEWVRSELKYDGIYRNGIIKLLADNGFRKITQTNKSYIFVRDVANIVEEVDHINMKDFTRKYINGFDSNIQFPYGESSIELTLDKLTEDFLTSAHTIFNHTFLSALPEHTTAFLKDDTDTMYFPFSKTVAVVDIEGSIEIRQYSDLENLCVWKNRIINHDLIFGNDRQPRNKCHFARFITNVSDQDQSRVMAFRTAIGYMLHNFNRGSDGQAVILNDEAITNVETPEGGTGKGLFINSLAEMRDMCKLDGKRFDGNERFCFQAVRTSTQIIAIDDLKPKTPFSRFFSVLTEGFEVERKNMESQHIEPADSPKLLLSSNYTIASEGSSNRRRQFVLEFGDFYSSKIKKGTEKPIILEHGCTFFSKDWDTAEWNSFYSYMLESAAIYLQDGLLGYENKNLANNRVKQVCGSDFYEWVTTKIELGELKIGVSYQVKTFYTDFKAIYFGDDDRFKQNTFTGLLKKMAAAYGWEVKTANSNSVAYITFQSGKS